MADELKLVTRGNKKLGGRVYVTSLTSGESCPGASSWCEALCYAKKGFFQMPTIQQRYQQQLVLLREDPGAYQAQLTLEVAKLRPGSLFRFHVSGDIDSVEHVGIIAAVTKSRPDVEFWLYTRSYRVTAIRRAVEKQLFQLPNLHVWASTDPSMPAAPEGWREARVFDTEGEAREARFPVCPEQTGLRPDCQSCGLCWHAKPSARLAFISH